MFLLSVLSSLMLSFTYTEVTPANYSIDEVTPKAPNPRNSTRPRPESPRKEGTRVLRGLHPGIGRAQEGQQLPVGWARPPDTQAVIKRFQVQCSSAIPWR